MAITRINNNQISDSSVGNTYLGINAAVKLQNYSITATKIANSLTYGSDLVITGNLTVQGNTTTIDTVNLIVDDPLMLLAAQQTGAPAVDIGFIGQRGTSNNIAFVWQESSQQFITAFTTTGISNTTISVASYANFQTLNANVTGILTVTGATGLTGNATFGNVFVGASKTIDVGNNIIANVQTPTANSDAATKGYVDGLSGAGFIVSDGSNTQTVAGGATLFIRGTANQVSVVVGATDNVTIGLPSSVTISGNITSGNLISNAAIEGVTITASGNLNGNNATITNAVAASSGSFTGNILAGNVNSNAAVTGVTITASGNLNGNNATITNAVAAATGAFTGNVTTGNVATGILTASGQIISTSPGSASTGAGQLYLNGSGNNRIDFNTNGTGAPAFTIRSAGTKVVLYPSLTGGTTDYAMGVDAATLWSSIPEYSDSFKFKWYGATTEIANLTGTGSFSVASNLTSGATVTGVTVTASGNLNGNNATITNDVAAASGSFTGNILAGNLNSNAAITGVTVTATGNLVGGNANITNAVNAVSGSFTGNVTTGNVSGTTVAGTTGAFTGNVSGANINTNSIVGTAVSITSTGVLTLAPTGNITVNSKNINSLADPVQAQDAATKNYVDTVAQGLDPKASVVYATSANLASYTYDNGTSGVGATLTAQSVGNLLVNSNLVSAGQRILIKDEVGAYVNTTTQSAAFNGIYTVTTAGAVAAAYVLTRSTDFDLAAEMPSAFTFVESGGTNADTGWVCTTNSPITVGTTQIIFAQFSGAGSYTAGNALSLNGTQFNVLTDGNIGVNGSNQLFIVSGATLVTPNIGDATGKSLTLSGNGLLSATTVTATGNVLAGNVNSNAAVTGVTITASGNLNGNNATITNAVAAATGAFTGNVTTGNVSGGIGSFTGNVLAGNLNSNAAVTGVTITASGNLNGNNATITNAVAAATGAFTGNVSAGNVNVTGTTASTSKTTGALKVAGGVGVAGDIYAGNSVVVDGGAYGNVTTTQFASVFGSGEGPNPYSIMQVRSSDGASGLGMQAYTGSGTLYGNTNIIFALATIRDRDVPSNLVTKAYIDSTGLSVTGIVSATGNVTGGNVISNALVSGTSGGFTGNVLAGNVNSNAAVTGVTFTATGNLNGNNATITNAVAAATGAFTGNVTTGNVSGTTVTGTTGAFTGNVLAGNLNSNAAVTGVTITASGNVTGGNIDTSGKANLGNIRISGNDITSVDTSLTINSAAANVSVKFSGTAANLMVLDAPTNTVNIGTGTAVTGAKLQIASTDSMLVPVGNTTQRPTGVTGMLRFNTALNQLEMYNNTTWAGAGSVFTVITADEFVGNGVQTNFTLSANSTTAATIVAINGVMQIPTTAYSVSGNVLSFTEAPAVSDYVDARGLTSTTTVTGISNATNTAVIAAVEGAAQVDITGNLVPISNVTYDLGSSTRYWNNLYLAGNTIFLGSLQLKDIGGNTFAVYTDNGTTAANLSVGNIAVSSIVSGTSVIGISGAGGNAYITVGGTANVLVVASTGANVTGTLGVSSNITAVGNVSGNYYIGNGSQLTGIDATAIQNGTANVRAFNNANVTVSASGNANILVVTGTGANIAGTLNATGNANVGNLGATNIVGTLTTAAQTNITSVGTLTSLAVTGNITSGNVQGTTVSGTTGTFSGNVTTGNVSGTTGAFTNVGGTLTTAAQTNITSVGTLTSLAVTGNITSGNLSGTSIVGTLTTAAQTNITSVGTLTSLAVTGNITSGNLSGTSIVGTLTTAAQTNITSVGTLTSLGVTGNITSGNLSVGTGTVTVGNIVNANGNAVGNIGSSTLYFNTVFAKATSAQYADLAEMYEADQFIPSGTVVCFGGNKEVTVCSEDASRRVAGVISTNPSYIMNAGLQGDCVVAVALTGRVPCRVTGAVRKGDMMVSTGDGRARAEENPATGSVIGKALADFDGADGVIEVVVGRL